MPSLRQAPLCVALALFLASAAARADPHELARAQRRQGIGLVAAGLGFAVVGAGLLIGARFTPSCDAGSPADHLTCASPGWIDLRPPSPLDYAGAFAGLVGIVITTMGAIDWTVGARRLRRSP